MKNSLFVTYILMFLVGCSSNFGASQKNEVVKPVTPTTKNTNSYTAKKSTTPKLKYSKLELPINTALSGSSGSSSSSSSSSSKYTQKRIYTCSQLNESSAYSLMRSGHSYLDRDGDGHPCEWGKKTIKSYTPTYKSNCHYVGGYYRKSGTYVRGHRRCR